MSRPNLLDFLFGALESLLQFPGDRLELPSQHPRRTSFVLAMLMFYIMATLAGYKIDFLNANPNLSSGTLIAILWVLLIVAPILTYIISYILMKAAYRSREVEIEFTGRASAADD